MPVVIEPIYKEMDTEPTSSSSDIAQCESRLIIHTIVAILPIYKELDTVTTSSSDTAQCESRVIVCTVAKKIVKRGGDVLISFF
jgi:hypothetical protein